MCDDCFQNLIYKFDSQKEFEDFETIIHNKCIDNILEIVKREETQYWAPFDSYEFYKCRSCGQIWILSIPENSWRGFFLTQDVGLEYTKQLKEKDHGKRIGCWIVTLVLVLVIIWVLATFA